MGPSNGLFCEAGSFCPNRNPHRFTIRGFEALFPLAGSLGCLVCLTPQVFLLVYPHANVVLPALVPQPPSCHKSFLPQLAISTPPICLDECFFFHALAVGLPYSSIFWQFWLFFVFKLAVFLLFVVRGGTVYLTTPPSWLKSMCYIF